MLFNIDVNGQLFSNLNEAPIAKWRKTLKVIIRFKVIWQMIKQFSHPRFCYVNVLAIYLSIVYSSLSLENEIYINFWQMLLFFLCSHFINFQFEITHIMIAAVHMVKHKNSFSYVFIKTLNHLRDKTAYKYLPD